MRRVKVRTYSGVVCEQEVFDIPDKLQDVRTARLRRPRFATPEEREQHKLEISRRKHTRLFNANFGPTSLYSTLTFSNEYEVHTFEEAKRLRDNFIRRLQYAYPDVRIMAYLGRGKATQRIHMHMVSEGVPEEYIRKQWYLGSVVRIEHLREHCYYDGVDHGQDYTGLANYLFDHWTPEQGGPPKTCGSRSGKSQRRSSGSTASESRPRPPRAICWWRAGRPGMGISTLNMSKSPIRPAGGQGRS